jgi:DNA polymerase II small subunit
VDNLDFGTEISNALCFAISKGYQIHPDAFEMLKGLDIDILRIIQDIIKAKVASKDNSIILVEDIKMVVDKHSKNGESQNQIQNSSYGKSLSSSSSSSLDLLHLRNSDTSEPVSYRVLLDPTPIINSGEGVEGYTSLFRSRYEKSMHILSLRPDSRRITRVKTLKKKKTDTGNHKPYMQYEQISGLSSTMVVAGLVMSRQFKRHGLEIVIDDFSGDLHAMGTTEDIKKQGSLITTDQMVMLELENGGKSQNFVIKNIISPDIPDHLPNRAKSESYVVLISDLHVGSKYFMETAFMKFLNWISSTDDEIVRKIKFLCIGGDLIDGIGIFPNQDKELLELNINSQMSHVMDLLSRIPKHINVFVIPGNHDPGRRALPQPSIPRQSSEKLYTFQNFKMLGNPSLIELNGVKILMYHGQGLDDIIGTIPDLSYAKPAEAMKVLLRARHLSPIYGERTPIAPEQEDHMVITEVPDIFHSGHIHVLDAQNYRGTLIVNSGTWQGQTNFQRTMGIIPNPGVAVIVDLSTLQPFIMDFSQ